MGELTSKFSREDIETLLEAMSGWEAFGSQEWHIMNTVKNTPLPPPDHETYEMISTVKEHFRQREKEIKENQITRQEKGVFLKAKLMLARRDMGINQLFEMATSTEPIAPLVQEAPITSNKPDNEPKDFEKALEKAEFFIKDLGVWPHYQAFLAE